MGVSKARKRRHRRSNNALFSGPNSKRPHTKKSGRTGGIHSKKLKSARNPNL